MLISEKNCTFLLTAAAYHSVDGHVENSPRPHDIKQAVNVLEDGDHHFILVFGSRSVEEETKWRLGNASFMNFYICINLHKYFKFRKRLFQLNYWLPNKLHWKQKPHREYVSVISEMNWAVNTEDRSFMSRLNWERFLLVFWMRAGVNDPIHVQVQIVKFHLIGIWLRCINRNTNSITLLPLLTWKETKKITFFASELILWTKIHLQLLWTALTQNLVTFLQTCTSGYSTDFRKLCDYVGYVCCRQFFTFVCNVYGK